MKGMAGLVIIDGWSPYSSSTVNVMRQCMLCPKRAVEMGGWWWRWEEIGRLSVSICGDCFSKIRRKVEDMPRCERCHSTHLLYDRVGIDQIPRVTCEICAWHKEGVQVPGELTTGETVMRRVGSPRGGRPESHVVAAGVPS